MIVLQTKHSINITVTNSFAKGCNGKNTKCITHNLWDDLEQHINTFFENKNLSDLLKQNNRSVN